jgi:hypothetical protein
MSLPDPFDKADADQEIAYILWNQGEAKQAADFFDCGFRVAIKSPPDRPIGMARIRSKISAITTTNWKCFTGVA